jgi:hypothetical protein
MPRRSNKSIAKVLESQMLSGQSSKSNDDFLLEKKITMATEGFTELILRDRNRLSKENALTVSEYIIVM